MESKYQSVISKYQQVLVKNKRISNLAGYVKLVLFVLFLVQIYYLFSQTLKTSGIIVIFILFAAQLAAWLYHAFINGIIHHAQSLIDINQRCLDRMSGKWVEFTDTGDEYIDPAHPYCCDLDITGRKSLFQFINVTHTWYGRQAFADDLLTGAYSKDEIEQRQQAIQELSEKIDLTNELEFHFSEIGFSADTPELIKELSGNSSFLASRFLTLLLTYLPVVTVITGAAALIFRLPPLYAPALALLAVQTLLWLIGSSRCHNYLRGITSLSFHLSAYQDVLELFGSQDFKSHTLRQMQSELTASDISAFKAMKELAAIADMAGIRSSAFLYLTLNPLLLWDYECAFRLEKWKQKYTGQCENWFQTLGNLESLLCFSVFRNVSSHTCFPAISEKRGVTAEELGHPLLPDAARINNPLKLDNHILIISGSNMSGKTTYLRTIGINIVLARAGAPVCAAKMTCSDLHVITSMRIADDLNEGISTFYAELKRVKEILDHAAADTNTLFLIDEIFRGTNSVDRLAGAQTVIRKLSQMNSLGLVTTHDLELCDLKNSINRIENYNFSEYYKDGQICFDYRLKPGKSQTTNAKYLMEMIGILT